MAQTFKLPDLGEGIHEAEIQEVLVSTGDDVEEGQPVLTVETDKASVEVPSPYNGTVTEIKVEAGDLVQVGDPLLIFSEVEEKAEEPAKKEKPPAQEAKPEKEPPRAEGKEAIQEPAAERAQGRPVPASPATRRLARELSVDLRQVPPSGPAGRVTAQDVRSFAEEGAEEKAVTPKPSEEKPARPPRERATRPVEAPSLPDFSRWGQVERIPLRSVRRAIAEKMTQAWSQIPHVSHTDLADITELDRLRRHYKDEMEAGSLTLTVFVMKAVVAALKAFPRFNASLDVETEEIILKHYHHLGVAVDTDRGLVVPVIRDVDRKSIAELSEELQEVVERTRAGETSLEDVQGGSFTITNVGILGGTTFVPIINYPQVAILGMAQARWQPTVRNPGDEGAMKIEPRFTLPLIAAVDHRVLDGADAARFVTMLVNILEDPDKLMLML
jgi:pyruvate dehydrogenase E2 component (dihydrolipoamide acetyltransferase)